MALWEKSMRLQGPLLEQMKSLYGPHLPIEVRHYLATWIESQAWSDVDPDNPIHEDAGRRLFEGLLQALKDLSTTYANNFITLTQLEALFAHMNSQYMGHAMELVRVVKRCLFIEAELVEKQEQLSAPSPLAHQPPTNHSQIQQFIQQIIGKTEALESIFHILSTKLENYMLHYQESYQIDMALQQGTIPPEQLKRYQDRKQLLVGALTKSTKDMKAACLDFSQHFMDCLAHVRQAQAVLVGQELVAWRQSQRRFTWEDDRGKGELNVLQQWFEALAELIWRNRQIAKQFEMLKPRIPQSMQSEDHFAGAAQLVTQLLVDLVQASFILEKQPPQVIKTTNRFAATVRLLVGSKLQIHLGVPEVTVTIINDKQARAIVADPAKAIAPNLKSGEILNNQKAMEYNSGTGHLSCAFNFMQLRGIKRNADRKSSEMVTEEKFTLLFRTHFTIGGGELEISVRMESLPVVVIVHVTQQPPAEATIFWDNSFSDSNREPFVVPDSVPWPQLSEALNCFFHANTSRGLTPQNLDYLGRRLLAAGPEDDISLRSVTRQSLCKEQLLGRSFTFWEWFYKHLDLIKTTLKREWMEGSIQGFMQKAEAERLLLACSPGTFLIRFSEGEPGGISVAWVTDADLVEQRQVLSLAPWNKHDLTIRAFADRLYDLGHLVYLFPSKPKDEVFGKYYTMLPPQVETEGGYVPSALTTNIPLQFRKLGFGSNPASPAPSIVSIGTPLSPPQSWLNELSGGNLGGLVELGETDWDATPLHH